jgi:hypothetical protein
MGETGKAQSYGPNPTCARFFLKILLTGKMLTKKSPGCL